ncbi:transketolase [Desulfovibrio sp. OttesenSCG-928-I05]|nr:transketolase [Desulfovibrio sp. OttesenSCG-928-I05]
MPTRKELANAVRVLSMDAVEKANSGHPGAPMGMADMAEALWNGFMRHNPANPDWANRDRFILSNGHAVAMLYSVLHLNGYDLPMSELERFRQLGSRTPGHPEFGITPGVEATGGPLGQGIAMAVGLALAERALAAEFNRDNFPIVDHYTYVFLGEGCLMEGVSGEASSLAGTLGLGKLICLFDKNGISIDGKVEGWFTEDVAMRYKSYGWHVIDNVDGHDATALRRAISRARKITDKPSLIICKTEMAHMAPTKAGSESAHGSPLGAEEIAGAKKAMGWDAPAFTVPGDIKKGWDARRRGKAAEKQWNELFAAYATAYPKEAAEFSRRMKGELPSGWEQAAQAFIAETQKSDKAVATRAASKSALNAYVPGRLPEVMGGAADLTPSVNTRFEGSKILGKDDYSGRYITYGVREFAMGCIMNGLALHGGFMPYAGTFLVFSDYARGAIRLSCLMKQRVVWVLTHDSIGVGEDGPTHQPVEQVPSLRLIPGNHVWRPCDAAETAVAWKSAIMRQDGPSCLALSRQNLAPMQRDAAQLAAIEKGGYVLRDSKGAPEAIIIATGSEVALAVQAAEQLEASGKRVRVVSMPCAELFDTQSTDWKESVLPSSVTARVAVEAAAADWWGKYTGFSGKVVGMRSFGESAPAGQLFKHFEITTDAVIAAVEELL